MSDFGDMLLQWLQTSGLKVIIILGGAFLVIRLSFILINRIRVLADDGDPNLVSEREKRAATLSYILRQISVILISGVAVMMILREFRIDIAPIIAGAGIVGLAVGFGAQSLVKDVISGFFILLENQFDVGDVIAGAGVSGAVEKVNLRYTQLRDIEGRVHFIPNGEFRVVSNMTRGWSQAVIDVGVAYKENLDRVNEVLADIGRGLSNDPVYGAWLTHPMEILGVENLTDSAVTIRVLFKTIPGKHVATAREFRKRVKTHFDRAGIEIPFPQRVVHMIPETSRKSDASRPPETPRSPETPGPPA